MNSNVKTSKKDKLKTIGYLMIKKLDRKLDRK